MIFYEMIIEGILKMIGRVFYCVVICVFFNVLQ